jgi:iron(III) transport system permease protein
MEEAARGLGKGTWETFVRINLPLLRPAIAAGAILVALYVLGEFGAVAMLRYDTLTPLVYTQYATRFDRGFAALLALPLLALAVLLLALDGLTRGGARYYTRGQRRHRTKLRLGAWRWPAVLACAAAPVLGVGLPVTVIVYWLLQGLRSGESTRFVAEAVMTSAQASGLAAVAAVVAALPLAFLSVRHRNVMSSSLEKVAYVGHALPGITIALALVFFASTYATGVYQTIGLLVFAYVVRFLPEALGACRSSMLQTNPNTEEAARGLGAGSFRVFVRITLPQILPGITAGALLVFLTAMKELPITLLLSPIGSQTLATQIWSSTSEAFFTRAALPSLVLVALSGSAVFIMLRRERLQP